jgi:hypothetical protein
MVLQPLRNGEISQPGGSHRPQKGHYRRARRHLIRLNFILFTRCQVHCGLLLQSGSDMGTAQEHLGHGSVNATMFTPMFSIVAGRAQRFPLDRI